LRVEPERLDSLIAAYELAADRIAVIISKVALQGRLPEPWTHDKVSVEMAAHYNDQVYDGEFSTYNALRRYEIELRAAGRTLRQIVADYRNTEEAAVASLR
jgi:hypothetical protein